MRSPHDISVVIPTYNRAHRLPALVSRLVDQQTDDVRLQILIVDNLSTDRTAEVAASLCDGATVQYVCESRRGASNARNRGIALASADLIAFLDDDILPAPDWARELKRVFEEHPEVDCVGGRIDAEWPTPPPDWLTPRNYGPLALQLGRGSSRYLDAEHASACLVSANFACRRSVFLDVGGFSPAYARDEDREFNLRLWRAGKRGMYADSVRVTALVQPERLTKAYHRRWYGVTGANHARMRYREIIDRDGRLTGLLGKRRLLGTPGFMYRELAATGWQFAAHWVRRRHVEAFQAECHLRYLVSYIRTRRREREPPDQHASCFVTQ